MITQKKETNKSNKLNIPRLFSNKVIPDIDFFELVVQCGVPVVSNPF